MYTITATSAATILHHPHFLRAPLNQTPPPCLSLTHYRRFPRILSPICSSSSDGQGRNTGDSSPSPPPITPPNMVEIRFRRGAKARRQRRQQGLDAEGTEPMAAARTPQAPKTWEEMTLSEKALELYMGEKGLLFWLNKFAYASIFIIIGGWILFRFVGPSLNLYQLDSPPLAPNAMFKGS